LGGPMGSFFNFLEAKNPKKNFPFNLGLNKFYLFPAFKFHSFFLYQNSLGGPAHSFPIKPLVFLGQTSIWGVHPLGIFHTYSFRAWPFIFKFRGIQTLLTLTPKIFSENFFNLWAREFIPFFLKTLTFWKAFLNLGGPDFLPLNLFYVFSQRANSSFFKTPLLLLNAPSRIGGIWGLKRGPPLRVSPPFGETWRPFFPPFLWKSPRGRVSLLERPSPKPFFRALSSASLRVWRCPHVAGRVSTRRRLLLY